MNNILRKIATFALVIVGFLLTAFLILVTMGAFDYVADISDNRVVYTLVIIFAVIYVVLGVVIVLDIFAGRNGLSTLVLASDNVSATSTTSRVVRRLIKKSAKALENVRLKKLVIEQDDKPGFKLALHVKIKGGDVQATANKLKYLTETSCKDVLGVVFNSIQIKVVRLQAAHEPDIEGAEKYADKVNKKEICKEACEMVAEQPANTIVSPGQAAEVLDESQQIAQQNVEAAEEKTESEEKSETESDAVEA